MEKIESVQVKTMCLHCGQPSLVGTLFCCAGCEGVYQVIQGAGLLDYYQKAKGAIQPALNIRQESLRNYESSVIKLDEYLNKIEFYIEGITCGACLWLLEQVPRLNSKIRSVRASGENHTVEIIFENSILVSELVQVFSKLGFRAHLRDSENIKKIKISEDRLWLLRTGAAGASSVASMHVALMLYAGFLDGMPHAMVKNLGWFSLLVALPALTFSAWPFYRSAWISLKLKDFFNLDVLVTLSILVGSMISLIHLSTGQNEFYFDSLSMLIGLLLLGRFLVHLIERRHHEKLSSLIRNRFGFDERIKNDSTLEVLSGEVIPCDGRILSGDTLVDESWLSGEAEPLSRGIGEMVFAGSINLRSVIQLKVTATGQVTRAGQLIQLLSNTKKSQAELFSKKCERAIVGSVLIIGAITAAFGHWSELVALLIVTCPCALGLANPAVIAVALSQAMEKGILVKGGRSLEVLNDIDTVVLDKTGTLSTSEYELVNETWWTSEQEKMHYQVILAQMAASSTHPILTPWKSSLKSKGFGEVKEVTGKGLALNSVDGDYLLGKAAFACPGLVSTETSESYSELWFSLNHIPLAKFEMKSQSQAGAFGLVNFLKKNFQVFLVSGDRKSVVNGVALELGIDNANVYSEVSPEGKLLIVQNLCKTHHVLMIGDGINDTLAFKQSHLSLSVGGAADLALETSDIHLTKPDLSAVRELFLAAKKVRFVMWLNLAWACGYNIVGIYLVLTGLIGPIACAILMPLSSISVLLNAHLRRYFP